METVLRTIFYQFFILFLLSSFLILFKPDWVAQKTLLVSRFINNAFFPIEWNEKTEKIVKTIGANKLACMVDFPEDFCILEDKIYANQEWYWAKYKYTKNNTCITEEKTTRVRWKTWEYYYYFDETI